MNHTAAIIAVAYGIVVFLGVVLALGLWVSTRRAEPIDEDRFARREKTWLFIAVGILAALLFGTIFFTPYGKSAGPDAQVVHVTARQFAWQLDRRAVRANVPVEFVLDTPDVNHGFGVYDDDLKFLFQVQVVPEQTQTVVHTFTKPGRYRILCLEFCGLGHDAMLATFVVTR